MVFRHDEQIQENFGEGVSRRILAHDANLMLVELYFEQGAKGALHSHVHEQVSYVQTGKFEFEVDGKKQQMNVGDSIFLPTNSQHGATCLEKGVLLDIFTPRREDFLK